MLKTAIDAAKAAGEIILKNQNVAATVTYKDAHNIVTDTDVQAEQAIIGTLRSTFPDHAFFSEEQGTIDSSSDYRWIIDPLDGTTNFAHHLAYVAVSIALLHHEEPLLAVVYNPLANELFAAERGKGATLNNQPIQPSTTHTFEQALLSLGRGTTDTAKARHGALMQRLVSHTRSLRILGSTALGICYTACGRFDANITNDCMFYDCAAGNLIAQEAGAVVSDFQGAPWTKYKGDSKDVLVTSSSLHKKFVALLTQQNI